VEKLARLKWPIILTVIGVGVTACAVIAIYKSFTDPGISIAVPGETTFTIAKPGNYTLWSEVSASFDGQLMTFATGLPPGVTIKITRNDGTIVPLESRWPTTTTNENDIIRRMIGKVRFNVSGTYRISTDGLQEKRALRLDQFEFSDLFLTAMLVFAGQPLIVAGLAWGLYVLFTARKRPPAQTVPPPVPRPLA
jgi:hypothetical protein